MFNVNLGFTLIEVLIVIAIIGILAVVAVPSYITYTKKAYFSEVIQATSPYKIAVESCYQIQGGGAAVRNCRNRSNGVPSALRTTGNVASVTTSAAGVITATGRAKAGTDTYILTPKPTNNVLTWTISGTCKKSGTC